MRIGVITALEDEAQTFPRATGCFADGSELVVATAGPGAVNAGRSAERLLAEGCTVLLSWGVAGALHSKVTPGTVIVVRRIYADDDAPATADDGVTQWLSATLKSLDAQVGDVYTAPRAVASPQEKSALYARFGAGAVDMESAAIARAALDANAKFGCVRAIVDPAQFRLPHAALHGLGPTGRVRATAALAQIIRHPAEIPDVIRLARWYRVALARLELAARALCG